MAKSPASDTAELLPTGTTGGGGKVIPKTLYVIDGGKGGTGKSFTTMVVADRLISLGLAERTFVLDGDVTNPDISRRFKASGAAIGEADLRISEEWLQALSFIEESQADYVVISLPATAEIGDLNTTLKKVASELGYRVVCLFVLNKNKNSIRLLEESYKGGCLAASDTYMVVINEFFGEAPKFRRWADSNAKKVVSADPRFAGVMILPELFYAAEDVLDAAEEYTPSQIVASGKLTVSLRVTLEAWLHKTFGEIEKSDTLVKAG